MKRAGLDNRLACLESETKLTLKSGINAINISHRGGKTLSPRTQAITVSDFQRVGAKVVSTAARPPAPSRPLPRRQDT